MLVLSWSCRLVITLTITIMASPGCAFTIGHALSYSQPLSEGETTPITADTSREDTGQEKMQEAERDGTNFFDRILHSKSVRPFLVDIICIAILIVILLLIFIYKCFGGLQSQSELGKRLIFAAEDMI